MGKPHLHLEAWKMATQLTAAIYQLTAEFPNEEKFGLAKQKRRGAGRNGTKEFMHFIGIARDSLAELETHLQFFVKLGFIKADHPVFELPDHPGKLLTVLFKKLASQ